MNEAVILCIVKPLQDGADPPGGTIEILYFVQAEPVRAENKDNVILSISIYRSFLKTSTEILESCNKHRGRQV